MIQMIIFYEILLITILNFDYKVHSSDKDEGLRDELFFLDNN